VPGMSKRFFLVCVFVSLVAVQPALADIPLSIAGRLNKPRSEDPIEVKKPSPVSKAYWSPNGAASADSVTTSIGASMVKWSVGIGVGSAIAILVFGTNGDSSSGGGSGGGGGHSHGSSGHSHSH
jgi:uncharacterized membrane protein YgcG